MIQDVIAPHDSVSKLFETIAQPTPEKVFEPEPEPIQPEIIVPETSPEKSFVNEDYIDTTTEAAMALLDSVHSTCFEIVANIKLEKRVAQIEPENGFGKLLDLKAKKEAEKTIVLSGKEAQLLDVDSKVRAFIERLPFSEQTKKTMLPGLKTIIQKNAGDIPPEFWLFAGLATSIGANIAELRRI
ncbi:MAG: hypothetical protein JST29_05595 [Bacteroidetes bacterium]|nr:hypothetical protein [Bacteroidota bacterium]